MEDFKQKQPLICPCCGKPTFEPPANIDQNTKQQYLACLMSGEPYKKTYKLYDGAVKVTLAQASSADLDKLTRLSAFASLQEDKQRRAVMSDLVSRLYRYITIVQIIISDQKTLNIRPVREQVQLILQEALKLPSTEQFTKMYQKLISKELIGTLPSMLLDKLIVTHNRILDLLVSSGFDDSFFEGIPHVS